jgi:hypothetical protein
MAEVLQDVDFGVQGLHNLCHPGEGQSNIEANEDATRPGPENLMHE